MTTSAIKLRQTEDGPDWQPHIRNKEKRRKLANRFKDSQDPFRIVIVRDIGEGSNRSMGRFPASGFGAMPHFEVSPSSPQLL